MWYFVRIIAMFVVIWLTGIILAFYAVFKYNAWSEPVISLFATIQPIASMFMAMTKSDEKKLYHTLIYFNC